MTKKLQLAMVVALAALWVAPAGVCKQRGAGQGKPRREKVSNSGNQKSQDQKRAEQAAREQQKADRQARGKEFQPGRAGAEPPPFLERLREMSPAEQRRFLENNQRFRNMPRDRQDQIRENLRRWNAMSPDQKQDMIHRERVWQQMTPEQRQRVRQEILPRWQNMDPQRRQAIVRRLGVLRPLSEEEREAKLKDEAFLAGLSPEEREILHTVAKLRLPAHGEPLPEPPQF